MVVVSARQSHGSLGLRRRGRMYPHHRPLLIIRRDDEGGGRVSAKCSFYLISFRWNPDGTWKYCDNSSNEELSITVPLANRSNEIIEQLPVSKDIKTLGSMTCPTGCNKAALERMQQQGQEWIDRVISGKVGRHNMWKMLDCQFWPRLGYAIGNNTASLPDFE